MSALQEFSDVKRLPLEYLERRHVAETGAGIRFDYGDQARARIRKSPKSAHPTYWASGDPNAMRVFGHQLASNFGGRSDKTLLLVEGESDTLTLWFHHRPAMGIPGATMTNVLLREDVAWADRVIAVREPGDAGAKFVESLARRLREIGFAGEILEVSLAPHKDASDLHVALDGSHERFLAALDEAIANATPVTVDAPKPSDSQVLSASDLLNCSEESIDYLIDGMLPRGGIMLVAGKPKCGKSVFARNLALAACRGSSFLGRQVEKTTVLWLCLEETRAQVSAAFRAMGLQPGDDIHFFFGHAAHDAHAWLQRTCKTVDAGLVVIDTWHKLTLIESVNDYGAVNRANQPLQQLAREKGVAQIWIHHSNKGIARNGSEVLGSQALFAAVDTLASMDRGEDGTRTVWTIQRSGDDLEPTVVTMNDDQQIFGAGTKRENEIARAEQRILDVVGTEAMTTGELREEASLRRSLFWSALASLVKKGLVRRDGRGSHADPFKYSLGDQHPVSGTNSKNIGDVVPIVPKTIKGPRGPDEIAAGTTSEPSGTSGTNGTSGTTGTTSDDELLAYATEVLGDA